MRISVFRIDFHTIKKDANGRETHRTGPERATVAAETLPDAIASLPKPQPGFENIVIQSHTLQSNVLFGEPAERTSPAPQPIRSAPLPKIPKEKQEEGQDEQSEEEAGESSGG